MEILKYVEKILGNVPTSTPDIGWAGWAGSLNFMFERLGRLAVFFFLQEPFLGFCQESS